MNLNVHVHAAFGLNKVIKDGDIITTLSISLVWIFYSLIPPYLLCHYHFIGKGQTLRWASKLAYVLSFFCGVAALVLIWLVYPRDVSPPTPFPLCSTPACVPHRLIANWTLRHVQICAVKESEK